MIDTETIKARFEALSPHLNERGFTASQKLVGRLLRCLGFSLQANRKTREGASHPDRNAQFEHINAQINGFQAAGQPTISVDTKKKELVGDFKNGGRERRPRGDPELVQVHDFRLPELGKVAPYGVYDIAANAGWINLGITTRWMTIYEDEGDEGPSGTEEWVYRIVNIDELGTS